MSFALTLGPWLIIVALVVIVVRYYRAARSGNFAPPVVVNSGAAMQAIQNALAGNSAAALTALVESFHLQVAAGSVEDKLLHAGFKELELRAADPTAKLPVIDYIAHFSNRTRDQVIAFLEAEFGVNQQTPPPALSPASIAAKAAALAGAVVLLGCLPAYGRSPIRVPQTWQPERQEVQIDPAVFSKPVPLSQRHMILLPDRQYVGYSPIYPDNYRPVYYQPVNYYGGNRGWHPGKIISAPVRWFGHRRWRLFGRRC